ncbi:hypothetical protein [Thalassomonas sp. M1454]|uniref:hypothetical protein n=1 Tax=Thalassomonas sp. M1454 TaxID=2594477 RepID=UPI00117BE2C8|nr:hypothetical protein [Thalassomonas sp. M1454]TRX57999.1 hypothetical protein FNN08_01020 [Thalassomonas sp. M1454]
MKSLNIKKIITKHLTILTFFISCICAFNVLAEDAIIDLSATELIGYTEPPKVFIELEVNKTRDLHVAFQNMDGWQTIKRTMKRIRESGKYHFEVPIDNLKPGKYRIDAYIAPRGKNWSDRLTETKHFEFEVVNEEKYVKKTLFSSQDKIKFVDWPKKIVGTQEATLKIKYDITETRNLHIKLLDSSNWKEYGALKFPVTEPGEITLPLSNLKSDFPEGKYAWVVFLTTSDDSTEMSEKYGKHFELIYGEEE